MDQVISKCVAKKVGGRRTMCVQDLRVSQASRSSAASEEGMWQAERANPSGPDVDELLFISIMALNRNPHQDFQGAGFISTSTDCNQLYMPSLVSTSSPGGRFTSDSPRPCYRRSQLLQEGPAKSSDFQRPFTPTPSSHSLRSFHYTFYIAANWLPPFTR